MSAGSLFQVVVEETKALLDRYGLRRESILLGEKGFDFDTVLKVLLYAFQETCDDAFFDGFYRLTNPLLKTRVEKIITGENVEADSEEIVTGVYEAVLDRFSESGIPSPAAWGTAFENFGARAGIGFPVRGAYVPAASVFSGDMRILDLLYTTAAGIVKGSNAALEERGATIGGEAEGDEKGDAQENTSKKVSFLDPVLFPVRLEEERREELLMSRIHEVICSGDLRLDEEERRILSAYYGGDGVKEGGVEKIAAAMDLSSDRIREVLFKASKEVLSLLSFGAGFTAEGEGES